MPLHPAAQEFLAQRAALTATPIDELSIDQARERAVRLSQLLGRGESVANVQDRMIPGPDGDIPIRIYSPQDEGSFPLHVYFHGGGFVTGNLETADFICRARTNALQCIVVSVNYRHAPEHKFPVAAEDAYTATLWISQNAHSFNGDANRLSVGGTRACLQTRQNALYCEA